MFVNTGRGPFLETAYSLGLDQDDDGRAVAPVDIDGDGDLDLAVLTLQGLRLHENTSPPGNFARVRLERPERRIGTVVRLTAGGATQQELLQATSGFATQVSWDLHFGLGEHDRIDRLVVRSPDGMERIFENLPANRLLVVGEGDGNPRVSALPRWKEREAGTVPPPLRHRGLYGDLYLIGKHHEERGDMPEALAAYERALRAHPAHLPTLEALASLHLVEQRNARARSVLETLLRHDPHSVKAHHNLGVVHTRDKNGPAAEAAFRAALRLDPERAKSLHGLGFILGTQGRMDEAAREFEKAVRLDATLIAAHFDLARAYLSLGRTGAAREALKTLLRLEPGHAGAQALLLRIGGR